MSIFMTVTFTLVPSHPIHQSTTRIQLSPGTFIVHRRCYRSASLAVGFLAKCSVLLSCRCIRTLSGTPMLFASARTLDL